MGDHDDRKHRITEIFGGVMERDQATELTDLLAPVAWEDLARRSDVEQLGTELRAEMASLGPELRTEMASLATGLRTELRGDMANLQGGLRNEIADVRKEVADLRVEVHDGFASLTGGVEGLKVRMLGLEGQLPKLIAANVASMVGVAGLVLAAGAL